MENILITGINGYIGSFLSEYLIKNKFLVDGVVRNYNNIDFLNKQIKVYTSDILNINELTLKKQYDLVIHLASANDVDSKNGKDALINTTLGTKKVLEFCNKNKITNLIYFSTFQVFGKDYGKINNNSKINCKNDYAITHFFAEEYIRNYSKNNKLNYIIVRPTNIYGSMISNKVDRNTLVPTCFCKNAIENKEINLLSSGKQYRNFISLEEVSQYIKLLIKDFKKYNKKELILASDLNIPIIKIAKLTQKIYKKKFKDTCTLNILSSSPKKVESLQIDIKPLPKLNFSKKNLKKEIEKIYNLMEQ